jgi:hypothetical protein
MRCLPMIAAAALVACGSSDTDWAPAFVGTWTGTTTYTVNGQSASGAGQVVVTESGTNQLSVSDVCSGGGGTLTATVTSATTATTTAYSCPAVASGSCSSVVQNIAAGSGSLSGATLSLSATGTLVGCGQTIPYQVTFSGQK